MRQLKLFSLFFALAASIGMMNAATVVTITNNDFPEMDVTFTKDGVTVWADWIDNMNSGNLVGPGSFSTTLGNFTKIEVNAGEVLALGEGWSGNSERQTWTGNASSVSFSGEIYGVGHGITIMCTIGDEDGGSTTPVLYLDSLGQTVAQETVAFNRPEAPEVAGFTFVRWDVIEGPLSEGIKLQAIYAENEPSGAPKKQVDKFTLTRKGDKNEYILQTAK